jgi:TrmH RNA methyltransferase
MRRNYHGIVGRVEAKAEVVYGLRAGIAAMEARPKDVVRVACAREVAETVERAAKRAPFAVLAERELERIASSSHHEGLCVEMRPRKWTSPQEVADLLAKKKGAALALDRVRNSYNVGAILRSAAFFGADALILGTPAPHPGLDANAVRVAEGGAERVVLSRTTDLADTLARAKTRGIRVVGTDGQAKTSALAHAFARPTIVVLGNEREGLGPRVRRECDELVAIPGSGAVESLNVGVAAGILLARIFGQ